MAVEEMRQSALAFMRPAPAAGGPVVLRDYQEAALAATENALAGGVERQVWSMATGLGKTICFAELARRRGGNTLILAHRDELIQQAVEKVLRVWAEADVGVVKAEQDDHTAPVVVASVQSLHERRLRRWTPERFDLVVVDECHHAAAPSYRRILDYLRPNLLLGVTATPFRGDRATLEGVFQKIVYSFGILEGIRAGHLVDIRAFRVHTSVALDDVHTAAGDFNAGELEEAVNVPDRNRAIVQAYLEHADGKRALVFTAGVEHARGLAEEFVGAGVPAAFVHGGTPLAERRDVLRRLRTGEVLVVTNCNVLTEGFDEPSLEAVILARPTKSLALFTQMAGRGTRPSPESGKRDLLLLDVVDATRRHRIVSVAELVGLRAKMKQGKTVTEALEDEERRIPEVEAFVRAVSPALEIEAVPDLLQDFVDVGEPPAYDWRDVLAELDDLRGDPDAISAVRADATARMGSPDEVPTDRQVARLQGFGWEEGEVRRCSRFEASWAIARHMDIMGAWLRARAHVWALVMGLQEEQAQQMVARHVWQYLPATEKQMALLKRKRVPVPPGGLTRGEAAAVLDRVLGGRKPVG